MAAAYSIPAASLEISEEIKKSRFITLIAHTPTVEAAKGQEFQAVMLPYLEAGAFPMAGCDRAEESNRFYVAITRVRDELSLYVPAAAERVSPFVEAMQVGKAVARGRLQVDAHF